MANYYVLIKEAVGGYKFDDFYTIKKDNSRIYERKNKGYKVRTLTERFDNDRDAVNFAKKYFVSLKKNPKPIKIKVYGYKSQLLGSYIYGKDKPLKFTEKELCDGDGYCNKDGTPCMKAHIYYWYLENKMWDEARKCIGRNIPNRKAHLKSKKEIFGAKNDLTAWQKFKLKHGHKSTKDLLNLKINENAEMIWQHKNNQWFYQSDVFTFITKLLKQRRAA